MTRWPARAPALAVQVVHPGSRRSTGRRKWQEHSRCAPPAACDSGEQAHADQHDDGDQPGIQRGMASRPPFAFPPEVPRLRASCTGERRGRRPRTRFPRRAGATAAAVACGHDDYPPPSRHPLRVSNSSTCRAARHRLPNAEADLIEGALARPGVHRRGRSPLAAPPKDRLGATPTGA